MYTNTITNDGFGSQYQHIICAILYTELALRSIFVLSKPDLETVYGEDAQDLRNIMNLDTVFSDAKHFDNVIQLSVADTYPYAENNLDTCLKSESIEKIRNAFHAKHQYKYNVFYNDINVIHVAIHIRRPSMHCNIDLPSHHDNMNIKQMSVDELALCSRRFADNNRYIEVMQKLRTKYNQMNAKCKFYIVSEGPPELFICFMKDDVELCLNETVEDSFCRLIYANVLVICSSSFSYVAALLSKNEIWYQPFWHKPASNWIAY